MFTEVRSLSLAVKAEPPFSSHRLCKTSVPPEPSSWDLPSAAAIAGMTATTTITTNARSVLPYPDAKTGAFGLHNDPNGRGCSDPPAAEHIGRRNTAAATGVDIDMVDSNDVCSDGSIRRPHISGPNLKDLPEEIQQRILDMLVGNLRSTSPTLSAKQGMRNWSNAMRHPRARDLSNLTLVTPAWRRMVQERLFRHVKVKGTRQGIEECAEWFLLHPHLQTYVRHIEFWVPVWEPRSNLLLGLDQPSPTMRSPSVVQRGTDGAMLPLPASPREFQSVEPISTAYKLSSQNSTLEELFRCVQCLFPSACVLTVEGGHCKKPPMVRQFRHPWAASGLPELKGIRTLIMRGAWNVIREERDFRIIAKALPNLREWQCAFSKPKTRAYATIYKVLRRIPPTLTHLNLCLEGFYGKKTIASAKIRDLQHQHHLCQSLGHVIPQIEALTFTGRVCSHLFTTAIDALGASSPPCRPRLRSLEVVVKNCCREVGDGWNDGTGIHNASFIQAFEALAVSASRALNFYPDLNFLRIHFIDLDAPYPLLNPYFQLVDGECTGIWNETILAYLAIARPKVRFAESLDGQSGRALSRAVLSYPAQRPRSIKISSYAAFADGVHLHGIP